MFFGQDPSRWQKKSLQLRHVNVLTTSWNANWSGKEFPGNSWLLLYKYTINTHKNTGVNEHENVCSFAKLAGPVAHWMRHCVFDAESPINIALEVRLLPGPLWLISLLLRSVSFCGSCFLFFFSFFFSFILLYSQHNIHFHSHFLHLDFLPSNP